MLVFHHRNLDACAPPAPRDPAQPGSRPGSTSAPVLLHPAHPADIHFTLLRCCSDESKRSTNFQLGQCYMGIHLSLTGEVSDFLWGWKNSCVDWIYGGWSSLST